jgi:hypothetical protein
VTSQYLWRRLDVHGLDAGWDYVACEHLPHDRLPMERKIVYLPASGIACGSGTGLKGLVPILALPSRESDEQ